MYYLYFAYKLVAAFHIVEKVSINLLLRIGNNLACSQLTIQFFVSL